MVATKLAGIFRAISGSPHPKNFTTAVIAAAGMSTRFGGETTKQMTTLCDLPLLLHTLRAYEDTECIHEIIVVARKEEIPVWEKACRDFCLPKVTKIVEGGDTRQKSVLNGLEAADRRCRFVAIADGARCLTTPEQIKAVCRAAYKYKAATAAHKSTDTVKIADKNGFIAETTDRDKVWLAQTPQVFKASLYRAAAYNALNDGFEATDDNSLIEYLNVPVRLVECGASNIKVTTQSDLAIAEGIIKSRRKVGNIQL